MTETLEPLIIDESRRCIGRRDNFQSRDYLAVKKLPGWRTVKNVLDFCRNLLGTWIHPLCRPAVCEIHPWMTQSFEDFRIQSSFNPMFFFFIRCCRPKKWGSQLQVPGEVDHLKHWKMSAFCCFFLGKKKQHAKHQKKHPNPRWLKKTGNSPSFFLFGARCGSAASWGSVWRKDPQPNKHQTSLQEVHSGNLTIAGWKIKIFNRIHTSSIRVHFLPIAMLVY